MFCIGMDREGSMGPLEPSERLLRTNATTRVIRKGDPIPDDDHEPELTPEQRIDAVWTLTKACMGWNSEGGDEPRLQRSVVHIQRRGR